MRTCTWVPHIKKGARLHFRHLLTNPLHLRLSPLTHTLLKPLRSQLNTNSCIIIIIRIRIRQSMNHSLFSIHLFLSSKSDIPCVFQAQLWIVRHTTTGHFCWFMHQNAALVSAPNWVQYVWFPDLELIMVVWLDTRHPTANSYTQYIHQCQRPQVSLRMQSGPKNLRVSCRSSTDEAPCDLGSSHLINHHSKMIIYHINRNIIITPF